ncbi:MAG TPA: hypothetical protein VHJ17_23455 [Thermomonospora sp.]|nr:hypothetical protein [Thermomonospora sp.]
MARRRPPSVTVEVTDGEGYIEVAGNAGGSMLLLAGDPAAVGGYDGSGSIGMLAGLAGAGAPSPAEVKSLVDWLELPGLRTLGRSRTAEPPDPERLRPLLRLFTPGRYVLTAHRPRVLVVDPAERPVWWCDEDVEAVLVRTDRLRSPAAVRRYRRRIEDGGGWPAVIALFPSLDAELGYVLDGHHKLTAYQEAGHDPMVISIRPETPFPPRRDDLRRVRSSELNGPLYEMRTSFERPGGVMQA